MRDVIRSGFVASLDQQLVDELLEAHAEAKRNFHSGGLRLSAVEGGRFCEAAFRLLQQRVWASFDPLGKQLNTDGIIKNLSNLPRASQPESVRLHIPRALRVVYDIRNKRDAAHLGDNIDPNLQDATLVVTVLDWVLAEFVRLYHNVGADEAQRIVEDLVARQAPIVQDFEGFLKVLDPSLPAREHCLVLLYARGPDGATFAEMSAWVRPSMRSNLQRTLRQLVHDRAYAHFDGERYRITQTGMQEVEARGLLVHGGA